MDNQLENRIETPEEENFEAAAPLRRKTGLVVGGLTFLVLLVAAAFLAGRLMRGGSGGTGGPNLFPGLSVMPGPGGAGEAMISREIQLEPAPELPKTPPDASGLFLRREDRSLFIGTGSLSVSVAAGDGESPLVTSENDGPPLEVVITAETRVYRDATMNDQGMPPESGVIQQKVEPGSIEDIGANSMLAVWGRKTGDRMVAEVLMYSEPVFARMP